MVCCLYSGAQILLDNARNALLRAVGRIGLVEAGVEVEYDLLVSRFP